jgi:glutamate synthase (NADPH/NADH) large chain
MLQKHYEYTGSMIAKFILEDLNNQLQYFVKVFPKDYKKVVQAKDMGVKAKKV